MLHILHAKNLPKPPSLSSTASPGLRHSSGKTWKVRYLILGLATTKHQATGPRAKSLSCQKSIIKRWKKTVLHVTSINAYTAHTCLKSPCQGAVWWCFLLPASAMTKLNSIVLNSKSQSECKLYMDDWMSNPHFEPPRPRLWLTGSTKRLHCNCRI